MSQLFAVGRVISGPELRTSVRQVPYARFSLAERIGAGNHAHDQYYRVWAWGQLAERLKHANVRTGTLIWVAGSLELDSYSRRDNGQTEQQMKLTLLDWGFLPAGNRQDNKTSSEQNEPGADWTDSDHAAVINGDRENLPA